MADSDIMKVKERINIVDIIGEYVTLKRAGANYVGLCPFHSERTPSFVVSPKEQRYHCFGCGDGGDVIDFMSKINGIDFRAALQSLADRAGVTIENSGESQKDICDVMELAQGYFVEELHKSPIAQSYLERRKITPGEAKKFNLGYSTRGWSDLLEYLHGQNISDKLILESGLAIQDEWGKLHDRFRGRIMFPIRDQIGRIVAFSGRIIDGEGPKYINSPEGELYSKRRSLYMIDRARQAMREKNRCIIVEGQMDAIRLHLNGYTETVATLGTALTKEQANLIKRSCNVCYICFDSDSAGQEAAMRGMYQLQSAGLEVYVVTLPFGKDPDELFSNSDAALPVTYGVTYGVTLPVTYPVTLRVTQIFENALESALPLVLQHLRAISKGLNSPKTRTSAVLSLYRGLSKLDNYAIAPYAIEIASALGIYPQHFWDDLRAFRTRNRLNIPRTVPQMSRTCPGHVTPVTGDSHACHTTVTEDVTHVTRDIPKAESAMCALLWNMKQPPKDVLKYISNNTAKEIAAFIMSTDHEVLKATWESNGDELPLKIIELGQYYLNIIRAKIPGVDLWEYTLNRLKRDHDRAIKQAIIAKVMKGMASAEDFKTLVELEHGQVVTTRYDAVTTRYDVVTTIQDTKVTPSSMPNVTNIYMSEMPNWNLEMSPAIA